MVKDAMELFIFMFDLLQSVSQLLWSCLSPDCPSYHIEASTLLTWLHSLTAHSSACEMVILEDLASKVF